MVSCGMNVIKFTLIIFNLVFVISGIAIIVCSGLVMANFVNVKHFLGDYVLAPPIVLIIVAASVFAVGCMGCCGARNESRFLLFTYAGCLLVIFITQLAIGIAAAVFKAQAKEILTKALRKSMEKYAKESKDKAAWDYIQTLHKCCGIYEPSDWKLYGEIPDTCCNTQDSFKGKPSLYCVGISKGKYMMQTGCFTQLKKLIEENENILMAVGLGVAFIEIVGIILSCWLAAAIKQDEEGYA